MSECPRSRLSEGDNVRARYVATMMMTIIHYTRRNGLCGQHRGTPGDVEEGTVSLA